MKVFGLLRTAEISVNRLRGFRLRDEGLSAARSDRRVHLCARGSLTALNILLTPIPLLSLPLPLPLLPLLPLLLLTPLHAPRGLF